jgi:hypothetical protein
MQGPSSKLLHILIGKSILETVLVGAVAVGFYAKAFPPTFHGWGEVPESSRSIVGWAVNNADPWGRVEVHLFVDGSLVGTQIANLSRPDVRDAGWAKDEWHGYNFTLAGLADGRHEARVYALHQSGNGVRYTLQLLGDPIPFVVEADAWKRPH